MPAELANGLKTESSRRVRDAGGKVSIFFDVSLKSDLLFPLCPAAIHTAIIRTAKKW